MNKITNPLAFDPANLQTPFGIFEMWLRQYMGANIAVMQPVVIVAVIENGKFVNVRPLLTHYDTAGREIPITDQNTIYNIPVMQPFGKNGMFQFMPSVGDQGLLFACNWDISGYKKSQSSGPVGSGRQFNWSDGFFLPFSFQSVSDELTIQNGAQIKVSSNSVEITAPKITINGDVEVSGQIKATGEVEGNGVKLSTHTHLVPAAAALTPPPAPTPSSGAPTPGT